MEACLVSLLEPGDLAIVGVNGYFGERLCEVAIRAGADVVGVQAHGPGARRGPAARTSGRRPSPPAGVVHAETSTGVRMDVAPLRASRTPDTLLVVDTVTSLGGIRVEVDAWGIDALLLGHQMPGGRAVGPGTGTSPSGPWIGSAGGSTRSAPLP